MRRDRHGRENQQGGHSEICEIEKVVALLVHDAHLHDEQGERRHLAYDLRRSGE